MSTNRETLVSALADLPDEIRVRFPAASYTQEEGRLTQRLLLTGLGKGCTERSLIDVAGAGRTGDQGVFEFYLSDYVCGERYYEGPINVLVSVRGTDPVHATADWNPASEGRDVRVTIRTCQVDGGPAAGTRVCWRIRAATLPYVE